LGVGVRGVEALGTWHLVLGTWSVARKLFFLTWCIRDVMRSDHVIKFLILRSNCRIMEEIIFLILIGIINSTRSMR
jgi:hypothetical protein